MSAVRVICIRCGLDSHRCTCPAETPRKPSRFERVACMAAEMIGCGVDPHLAIKRAADATRGEPS
jgi:hypothetical protein